MRTIGLIGGMSWESTAVYYRRINEQVRDRCGSLHSAEVIVHSVDFARIVAMQTAGAWDEAARALCDIACKLERAGAACVLICTNTMHKLAPEVTGAIGVPLVHITDVTGEAVRGQGSKRPLLLATKYTMEQDFYTERLRQQWGLEPIVPDADDRQVVHDVIFQELCCGIVRAQSRAAYLDIIARGKAKGADSVILGCTEIGLLIGAGDVDLPTLDSTLLHADAAVDYALAVA